MRLRLAIALAFTVAVSASAHAAYRISVWVSRDTWAPAPMQQHSGIVTESNPTYFRMETDGDIYESSKASEPQWLNATAGTEVYATFQNTADGISWSTMGQTTWTNVLTPASRRETYTNQIRDYAVAKGYAGVDIDYEWLPAEAKSDFNEFIRILADKLHAVHKKLSVCVYAKTKDTHSWFPKNSHDYAALGQYADYIKIMAYGENGATNPNATTTLLGEILTYAKSKMPASKIMLGIPWYGQDYPNSGPYDSLRYSEVQSILATRPHTTPVRHAPSGELTFTYTDTGGMQHTVWYSDVTSYVTKVRWVVLNHPDIAGFAHWSSGEEDPAVWGVIGQLKPRWEFNKDGNHDVVHRDTSGQVALWNMSSATVLTGTIAGADASFDVVAAGHFMRDGATDLLLRNYTTGEMKLWSMNNHTIGATYTLPTVADTNWKVVAAADLDADGRHEIIWHNQATGVVAWWRRDHGDGIWYGNYCGTPMAAPAWHLAGAADFNLDGRDDLLWRNQSTGDNVLWTMNGGTVTNSGGITHTAPPWTIAGVGDFNRDLYPDILWRNESTWETAIWLMNDRTIFSSGNTAQADPVYKIVRVGDFNGDGFSDILWRHSTAGDINLWQMNGYAWTGLPVSTPGPQWNITAK